jgi:hypothetical protein
MQHERLIFRETIPGNSLRKLTGISAVANGSALITERSGARGRSVLLRDTERSREELRYYAR